jgi:hypothetical protein
MANNTIKLSASAGYGYGGKQFCARITGRHPKFTFEYEFLGRKEGERGESTTVTVDESGLYVERDIDKKGSTDTFYLVWFDEGQERLRKIPVDRDIAMRIARGPLDAATMRVEGRADVRAFFKRLLAGVRPDAIECRKGSPLRISGLPDDRDAMIPADVYRAALTAEITRLSDDVKTVVSADPQTNETILDVDASLAASPIACAVADAFAGRWRDLRDDDPDLDAALIRLEAATRTSPLRKVQETRLQHRAHRTGVVR